MFVLPQIFSARVYSGWDAGVIPWPIGPALAWLLITVSVVSSLGLLGEVMRAQIRAATKAPTRSMLVRGDYREAA